MTVQESGLAPCLVSGLALIVALFALFALFAHIQHFSHHALMCMCVSAISAISALSEKLISALSEKLISALSVSLKNQNFYIRKGKTKMIIDLILDRKDGCKYSPREFYYNLLGYGGYYGDHISRCMDYFGESMVQKALCEYVLNNDYNPEICKYINSVNWLVSAD